MIYYREPAKGLQILLSWTQAGPGRAIKQEQEEISPNHVQAIYGASVLLLDTKNLCFQFFLQKLGPVFWDSHSLCAFCASSLNSVPLPVHGIRTKASGINRLAPRHPYRGIKVARWQNLIPSFPWIAPGWTAWGRNPRKRIVFSIFSPVIR